MRQPITSYRDLEAWQEAMELTTACYRLTSVFPQAEVFGLTSQIRRAVVPIPSNIAEGHRKSRPAFIAHLRIAAGSHAEVETQLELALRLGYATRKSASEVVAGTATVGRLVHGLLRSLVSRSRAVPQPPIPNPQPPA